MFIGRENELNKLEKMYASGKFEMAVIYGRRRVGKTALIREFCSGKKAIHFIAEEYNSSTGLKKMTEVTRNYFGIDRNYPEFENWEQLLMFIARAAQTERVVLALDEFPYLAESDKNLPSLLQRLIDTELAPGQLFIILCGSSISFMEQAVLGYNSPLFGRRTAQFKIQPFDFFESRKFLPNFAPEQQLQIYGAVGGIPQYLGFFTAQYDYAQAISESFLESGAYFYEEPILLLKQELREPMTYNSILAAIADGASKLNEIATKCGEPPEKCNKYLNTLIGLHIVERETSLLEKPNARKSLYKICDNMYRFWFKYIFRNKNMIEGGSPTVLLQKKILPDTETFCGPVFEQISAQWLLKKNARFELPFAFENYGRWWGSNPLTKQEEEIDICAVDGSNALIAECKWKNTVATKTVCANLQRKSGLIPRENRYLYLLTKKTIALKSAAVTGVSFQEMLTDVG